MESLAMDERLESLSDLDILCDAWRVMLIIPFAYASASSVPELLLAASPDFRATLAGADLPALASIAATFSESARSAMYASARSGISL
mmetsp:Transcript_32542/g.64844  ORF Transcript_32542/g.64844 Transcript_32542/m.64844 type:complete len:88 (-) Transcript_32542:80-343(-)